MQIILIKKIPQLGQIGDKITVKPGYARNFLIPQGKAISATKENITFFNKKITALNIQSAHLLKLAQERAKKINELNSITITSKAGKNGKLFGSIGIRDIVKAITNMGIKITKNEIRLPHGTLRTIGTHEVNFQIQKQIFGKILVNIITK